MNRSVVVFCRTEVLRTLSPQIPNVEAAVPKEAAKSRNVEHSAKTAAKNSAKGQIDVTQHLVRYMKYGI